MHLGDGIHEGVLKACASFVNIALVRPVADVFDLFEIIREEEPDAEELAIDAFAELYLRRDRYDDGRSSVKTYLYTIARSRALDFLRKKRRHQAYASSLEELPELSGTGELPEEQAERSARDKAVARAMQKLGPEMRQALYLFYFEKMSYGEIASVMKKSSKQIDNLLQRAKKEMKEFLGEEGRSLL